MKANKNQIPTSVISPEIADQSVSLTPIEKLLADKSAIEDRCIMQEKKLQDDYEYIRNNASNLFIKGLSSLLFSSSQAKNTPEKQSVALIDQKQPPQGNDLFSLSDLSVITRNMVPVIWGIAQPLLIKWSIQKGMSWLMGLFTKKKSTPSHN